MKRDLPCSGAQIVSDTTYRMVTGILVLWSLAMLIYAERFRIFEFAISSLGSVHTPNGHQNRNSMLLFILSMGFAAQAMLRLCFHYHRGQGANYRIYRFLYLFGAAGALIACIPTDIHKPLHSLGSGMLVFSHVFITVTRILSQSRYPSEKTAVIRLIVLMTPILIYAYTWAFWQEQPVQFFQKSALFVLFFSVVKTSKKDALSREVQLFAVRRHQHTKGRHSNA